MGIIYTVDPLGEFTHKLGLRSDGGAERRRPGPSTKSFDAKAMLMAAGHLKGSTRYFLPRARVTPPHQLLRQVLPWLPEELETMRKRNAMGGDRDLPAERFMEAALWLREVFLQDAVVLQHRFPGHEMFKHAVFRAPEWEKYKRELRGAMIRATREKYAAEDALKMRLSKVPLMFSGATGSVPLGAPLEAYIKCHRWDVAIQQRT